MGKPQRILCRFCLQKCIDFKAVEAYVKDVLDVLLLEINLTVSEEPVMCTNCAATLMRYFEFKATCFYTHDYIVPFLDDDKVSKLDLRKLYMSKHENVDIPEDHGACGLCIELTEKCTAISLNNDEKDVMLEKLMEKCLPELDLSTIEGPIICATCYESLTTCFHFVTSCLIVEEKVKAYHKLMGADIIEIADVLQFTSRNISEVEDITAIDVITTEGKFCVDTGNTDEHKNGSFVYMEEQKLLLNEDVEIKTEQLDFDRCLDSVVSPHLITNKSHGRKKCLTSQEVAIKPPNKYKKAHNVSGAIMYQCDLCLYCTNYVTNLKRHRRNHENPKEMKMYCCDCCSYETKYKKLLDNHTLEHHNSSEVPIDQTKSFSYQCNACPFRTKHRTNLQRHMITHRDISDTTMYQCYSCSFQTKHKNNLRGHMLTHKDPSKVKTYQCKSCPYQTKIRSHLNRHILIHAGPSETRLYQCDVCSFHTNYKNNLQTHMVTHKLSSETTMYQCHSCSFKTKHKYNLPAHMLTHKDPSEVTMYKCKSCLYQATTRSLLKRHYLTHIGPTEIKLYQCDACSFHTNHKGSLRRHMITHKRPSETTIYRCDTCSFHSNHKGSLRNHMITHKRPSETTIYQCDACSFHSVHNWSLQRHKLTHKLA